MQTDNKFSQPMTGNEKFVVNNNELNDTINNFWSWYASDLTRGTLRGALAEYIVDRALGVNSSKRNDWEPYDILYSYNGNNYRIEVKSSGLMQRKHGEPHYNDNPRFSIAPHNHDGEFKHHSDLYIFCYDTNKDVNETSVPLDNWKFYVITTSSLVSVVKEQSQTISLKRLNEFLESSNSVVLKANYNNLKDRVNEAIQSL